MSGISLISFGLVLFFQLFQSGTIAFKAAKLFHREPTLKMKLNTFGSLCFVGLLGSYGFSFNVRVGLTPSKHHRLAFLFVYIKIVVYQDV